MMTCNEDDVIEEVMAHHRKQFDCLLVLDGSTDRTEEIMRSFDCVKYFMKDQDIYPKRKIRDGARQFLLEKAQELFPVEGWFTLVHGDEIFVDDPTQIAIRAEKQGAEKVNWHALNFFLHTSQKEGVDANKPILESLTYYLVGGIEIRQFKNKPNLYYPLHQHHNLLPKGIGLMPLLDFPIFKHFVRRSESQVQKRMDPNRLVHQDPDPTDVVWRETLDPKFSLRNYEGSFLELEPGHRGSFIKQLFDHTFRYKKLSFL